MQIAVKCQTKQKLICNFCLKNIGYLSRFYGLKHVVIQIVSVWFVYFVIDYRSFRVASITCRTFISLLTWTYWLALKVILCVDMCFIMHEIRDRNTHDVQFASAITQPLLAHHWRVHQCLLTSCFIATLIPWGVSAPGGKMRKQLHKDHSFLIYNSPIFIIESSTVNIFAFQKAPHAIHFNLKKMF